MKYNIDNEILVSECKGIMKGLLDNIYRDMNNLSFDNIEELSERMNIYRIYIDRIERNITEAIINEVDDKSLY